MTLGALVDFANALELALGPIVSELLGIALLAALGWWRARTLIHKVEAKADAGIAAANERASTAKAEVRELKLSVASLEGSLRPAALTPMQQSPSPTPMQGTAISGHYPPVNISEIEKLPPPAPLPAFATRATPAERPSAKQDKP